MTYIWLMLLLPVIRVQCVSSVSSCPASCAVCSEDVIICQRLAHIIDAPDSTQALLLTEGSIAAVQPASLSDLSNITVIGLSHNHISELSAKAFTSLPFLHTLLLDHNLLTTQAIQRGALNNLTKLEYLTLGHNLINMIQASWFLGTKALRSLKLEGNLLTKLDSSSFPLRDLMHLDSLDLSDNLIDYLDKNSFRGLGSLKTLDLSRNRLSSAPVEAFSYLNWLTNLNLDLNSWNCSCQLLELATFLSAFMQQPDKALYNGRRMVCVSADNPAVTTVLELTDANCVPSNHNITIQVETKGSVTARVYARDLAITAVICFIGGVSLTLLVILAIFQVHQKKILKETQKNKDQSEESQAVAHHHIRHIDVSEGRHSFLQAGNNQQKEPLTVDAMLNGYITQTGTGAEENSGNERCLNCHINGLQPNPMRRENRVNGGMETEEARERRKLQIMMMEDERRRRVAQQSLYRDTPNRTTTKGRGHESSYCDSCYSTYRPPQQDVRQGKAYSNSRESTLVDGFPSQHRTNGGGRYGKHHFDMMKNTDFRRETRKVTFDPESLRLLEQRDSWDEERHGKRRGTSRDRERSKEKRHKAQSSRMTKVKLHLNPQRKSRIHPRKKHDHLEESKIRNGKEKDGNGKEVSERKRQKLEKSSKSERSKVEGEEKTEVDEGKQKKTTSTDHQERKEQTEGVEGKSEDAVQENTQPSDSTQPTSAGIPEQRQNLQQLQCPGTGSTQIGDQLSSRPTITISNADMSRTANLALTGGAGAHYSSSSSSSLQGGNALLSTFNLASNPLQSNGLTVSTLNAPNIGPRLALDNLGMQAAPSSLLLSPQHAMSLQAGAIHMVPPHPPQSGGFPMNLAANTAVLPSPQNLLAPDSSSLAFRMNLDPGQGPAAPVLETSFQQSADPAISRDTLLLVDQGNPSNATTLNIGSATTVENMSNNNSQRGITHDPRVPPANLETTEGMQAADVPVSGVSAPVTSTLRKSSSAGVLLQQEYLSEEGGSSPRRKLRLVLPEKSSSRPPTALEKKIR